MLPTRETMDAARKVAMSSNPSPAISACKKWLRLNPNAPEVLTIYGVAEARSGNTSRAHQLLAKAHEVKSNYVEPISALMEIAWQTGNIAEAHKWCQKWVALEPENPDSLSNLAGCCLRLQELDEAIEMLEKAVQLKPSLSIRQNLGLAYATAGRLNDAEAEYRRILEVDPRTVPALESLAALLAARAENKEAAELYRRAYEVQPDSASGRINMARSLVTSNKGFEEAERFLRSALQMEPANANALALFGFVLARRGAYDEAQASFLKAFELDPNASSALVDYSYITNFSTADPAITARIDSASENAALPLTDRRALKYAAAKVHDDLGEFEKAMKLLDEAHDLDRRILPSNFSRDHFVDFIDGLIAEDYRAVAANNLSDKPLFIVGMPRSGTTLVEQILSAHPLVAAAGEVNYWFPGGPSLFADGSKGPDVVACDYLALLEDEGKNAKFVTDKMPDNFLYLGLIHGVLPNARFIHCRRNAADTCLSIYFQLFSAPRMYAASKADLAFAYREYERLMDHWRRALPADHLFEVCYEELVSDPRPVVKDLLKFCDLEWDEACMRPEKNMREILTASHWQARQPIYRSSVAKWKRYEPWLGELRELIDPA